MESAERRPFTDAARLGGEADWWWPVALEGEGVHGPCRLELFDEALVLWRDATGQPVIQRDRCPHRGASLSLGRVCEGQLQCGYHGWRFDPTGRCVSVPALPGFQPPASAAVPTWPVRVHEGLLWTTAGDPGGAKIPALPGSLPTRRLVLGPFDVATSAARAVENFLDTAHFATVHDGWLGDPGHPEVPTHAVTLSVDGRPVVEAYRAWQPRASASAAGGAWVNYCYEVLSPYSALLTKQPEDGKAGPQDSYTIWACPTGDERCRLWFAQYTSDLDSSDQLLCEFQTTIFSQDQPVLESQRPRRLPISDEAPREVSTAADRLSAAYRRYLRQQGVRTGVC